MTACWAIQKWPYLKRKTSSLKWRNILVFTIKIGKQIVTQRPVKRNVKEMYRVLRRNEDIFHSK